MVTFQGDAGTNDTGIVHGTPGAEVYVLGNADAPLLTLQETAVVSLVLQLGTVESLAVSGGLGNDTFTVNELAGVSALPSLTFNGEAGAADAVIVNGSAGADVFELSNGFAPDLSLHQMSPTAATLRLGTVESLVVNGGNGDDRLTVNDLAGVIPLPSLAFNGQGGSGDAVVVHGSSGADVYALSNGSAPLLTVQSTSPTPFTLQLGTVESLTINGADANDTLTVNDLAGVSPVPTMTFNGQGGSGDAVVVHGSSGADVYALNNGSAPLLTVQSTSPTPFTLQLGTIETLEMNGGGGADAFTSGDLAGVTDLTAVEFSGDAANDQFDVNASATVAFTVNGGGEGADVLNYYHPTPDSVHSRSRGPHHYGTDRATGHI